MEKLLYKSTIRAPGKLATSQNKFVAEAQGSNEVIQSMHREKVASLIMGLE